MAVKLIQKHHLHCSRLHAPDDPNTFLGEEHLGGRECRPLLRAPERYLHVHVDVDEACCMIASLTDPKGNQAIQVHVHALLHIILNRLL